MEFITVLLTLVMAVTLLKQHTLYNLLAENNREIHGLNKRVAKLEGEKNG